MVKDTQMAGWRLGLALLLLWAWVTPPGVQAAEVLRLATTTSTEASGLLAELHPPFETTHSVRIHVISVGTGKALRLGEQGDVDVVLVHAPEAEEAFVAAGHGIDRRYVMGNDFVLLGPAADPAAAAAAADAPQALARIAAARTGFISRGDESGTHKLEQVLWAKAGIRPAGRWYMAAGQGMGAVLKMADDKQAYTLSDRGSYLAYRDKIALTVVHEGDPRLDNPYHVIAVNPQRHPHVNAALARRYMDFLTGPEGQALIGAFRLHGEALFHPAAGAAP